MRTRAVIRTRARVLRKSMSDPEVMLWTRLRGRREGRPTFRRQHPIESVIVDFFCSSAKLAIEVDGSTHWDDEKQRKDAARDRWLEHRGIVVMRIPASRVFSDLSGVVDGILWRVEELNRGSLRPAPSTTRSSASGPPPPSLPR